jgi:hypothetical protein
MERSTTGTTSGAAWPAKTSSCPRSGHWLVEAREGGADGTSRWFELPNEDLALDCVRDLISASDFDDWRELPVG